MTETVCVLCAEPVDPEADDTYCEEVGLHSLALRRGTNGFAHAECVDKLRAP